MAQIKRRHNPSIYLSNGWYFPDQYLVSFLTERMRFLIFFRDGTNVCFLLSLVFCPLKIVSLTKYSVLDWISFGTRQPSLICLPMKSFTFEPTGSITVATSPYWWNRCWFSFEKMTKYCRNPRFSQFFLLFFSVSRSSLKFWLIFLTQNFTGQSSFFIGWVCFLLFVKTWPCFKAAFFFSIYLSFFPLL